MIYYNTKKFDIDNDEILWEKFMCFIRLLIPYEKILNKLTDVQKNPVISFIYESEVMREGHIGFLDEYEELIKISDVINAFKILDIDKNYIANIKNMPSYIGLENIIETCLNEEEFDKKMCEIDHIYETYDKNFYDYGNEYIEDKILEYVRNHHYEFFSYQ